MSLRTVPARVKAARPAPAYAVLPALVALSCATSPPPSHESGPIQVTVPPPSAAPEVPPAKPLASAPPARVVPVSFPEDAEPLSLDIGCGGDCPPAWALAMQSKDMHQIQARIRACAPSGPGRVHVKAVVHKDGRTGTVEVTVEGTLPPTTKACVEKLVKSARFHSEPPYERTASETVDVP